MKTILEAIKLFMFNSNEHDNYDAHKFQNTYIYKHDEYNLLEFEINKRRISQHLRFINEQLKFHAQLR